MSHTQISFLRERTPVNTPIYQDAEDHFRLFLAGHAVPKKIFRKPSPRRSPQDEEDKLLARCGSLFACRMSAERQFWLLLLAVGGAVLNRLAGPLDSVRTLWRCLS